MTDEKLTHFYNEHGYGKAPLGTGRETFLERWLGVLLIAVVAVWGASVIWIVRSILTAL